MPDDSTAATGKVTQLGSAKGSDDDYVLPIVNMHVPSFAVNAGFWSALAGSVALGFVEPPLGMLVGAGVLIARHQTKK